MVLIISAQATDELLYGFDLCRSNSLVIIRPGMVEIGIAESDSGVIDCAVALERHGRRLFALFLHFAIINYMFDLQHYFIHK